tara:strand:- start:384 stop:2690 length:2307 start_codon:yes stop_codon:yes gene_type:complete
MADPIHKLATIVFTDIVGFTKLTADDQQKASDLLDIQRKEIKPLVESYQGKWVKEVGDGLILTFDTVNKAVHCCIKIQEKAKEIKDLKLRIGVHLGEILEKENDIIGDDVNITARIEPFSAPGGIAISNKVNDTLVREADFKTKYLGKPKLKGVGQNVEVYCIVSHGLPETNLSNVSAKLESEKKFFYPAIFGALFVSAIIYYFSFYTKTIDSIAVLYLDVNQNKELSYLETITEDLIFDLTTLSQGLLKVSEPSQVKTYKNSEMEIEEIATKMGVDYIFQSSIQPDDSGFHLRWRLFDSNKNKDLFTKKVFIESKNLQSIVGVLVDNIVKELDIETLSEFKRQEYDSEAYELYLQSKNVYSLSDNYDDNLKAIDLMTRAVDKDENLVFAKMFLGQMHFEQGNYDEASKFFEEALIKSKSLQDNSGIAESLRKQGQLLRKNKDYEGSISKLKEALSISSVMNDKNSMAKTMNSIAILYYRTGSLDDALEYWLQAFTIAKEIDDKLKISKYVNNIGIWYWKDSDYSKAIEYYLESLQIKEELGDTRNYGKTLNNLGEVYYDMGDFNSAVDYFNKSIAIKEKLNDNIGLNATLLNLGQAQLYNTDYDEALNVFKRSLKISQSFNDDYVSSERLKSIGITHFSLANYDSAAFYFKIADSIYSEYPVLRLTTLSWLAITNIKKGLKADARDYIKIFDTLIENSEPKSGDVISVYWNVYQAYKNLGEIKTGKGYLEDSYFEIKSRSRNIKNKADRKKYMAVKLHKDIIAAWDN